MATMSPKRAFDEIEILQDERLVEAEAHTDRRHGGGRRVDPQQQASGIAGTRAHQNKAHQTHAEQDGDEFKRPSKQEAKAAHH